MVVERPATATCHCCSFGHAGRKILVFPTSQGRFFEYEDNKMIAAVADKLENGEIQIYCVDSVDDESWYNKQAHPYWRLQRHLQYERYIINDVFPLMWNRTGRRTRPSRVAASAHITL